MKKLVSNYFAAFTQKVRLLPRSEEWSRIMTYACEFIVTRDKEIERLKKKNKMLDDFCSDLLDIQNLAKEE